jgi:rod shape-determining protein MreC
VQLAVASPFEGWHWFRESVTTRDTLRADNAKLEAELRVADFKLQRYEALEAETQRLRSLRENTVSVADHFLIGDIMDLDLDAFRERVLVNLGANRGVFVGQAVLDSGGVFGQVARVEQFTSEVILVSDPAHAIPVQINRNGLRTVAVGTGDTSRLKLPYLPTSADVVVGDLLLTSGLGGGFPPGYPVGTVSAVRRDPAQSLAEVDVRPAAALDRSRELMFVWLKPNATLPAASPGAGMASPGAAGESPASAASSTTAAAKAVPTATPAGAPTSAAASSANPGAPAEAAAAKPPPAKPAAAVPAKKPPHASTQSAGATPR